MYRFQFRVVYADIDKMGVMYHGNYARYLEMARVEQIRSLGISYAEIEEKGVMMPIVDWRIRFLRPALYDDVITINTTVQEPLPQQKIVFLSSLYNSNEKLLARAEVSICYLDTNTQKSIKAPDWLQDKIQKMLE